jgi:cell wall-associated NlpC family hydrolase
MGALMARRSAQGGRRGRVHCTGAAAAAGLIAVVAGCAVMGQAAAPAPSGLPNAGTLAISTLAFQRRTDPARTVALDRQGTEVAVFTDGARTVRLTGPTRTFVEPAFTTTRVTTDAWVRLAPVPWHKGAQTAEWFAPWLTSALADTSPDALGVSMQYLHGAADLVDADGRRYAGDASFGPPSTVDPDGRQENSDFLDYLGISWTFPDTGPRLPKPDRYGDVDCSGFLRLVYGFRLGYPLLGGNTAGPGLPRRAYAISAFGPGLLVITNDGAVPEDLSHLQAGDLVFFDTALNGALRTDHSGIYLGLDSQGRHRFISSRSHANGPTMGDLGGTATLDGGGYWPIRFRAARRI